MASNSNDNSISQGDLLTALRELLASQAQAQEQLRADFQRELRAQNPIKRVIPSIKKISKEEDFPVWRDNLIYTLNQFNLARYIQQDVPQPPDDQPAALTVWQEDRIDVDNYLRAHIGDNKIERNLESMGWDAKVANPKSTFDFLTKYFEGASSDTYAVLNEEFSTINRSKFASMDAFQSRVGYLRNRLKSPGSPWVATGDAAYIWMALRGIRSAYADLYARAVANIEKNELTWNGLMEEFQKITVSEKTQSGFTQIKVDTKKKDGDSNKKGSNNKSTSNNKEKDEERVPCSVCRELITPGWKHCGDCGYHRPARVPICWWCDPEKAPNTWPNKSVALIKKAERHLASTTGPLHQQSGLQNPTTAKAPVPTNPATKKVMFQTNLANLSINKGTMSSFQEGPQRN